MKIPRSQHEALPWRISEVAPDFDLIDAWALPVSGRRSDLAALEDIFLRFDPSADGGSRLAARLFALRWRLGRWFGWDDHTNALPIPGCRETSLRERLPADLRGEASAPADGQRFRLVYRTATEWARELSNATVHAVLHVGWIHQPDGSYRAQMGIYVKTRGWFGPMYMAVIRPFRHFIVYPALLRQIGRAWDTRAGHATLQGVSLQAHGDHEQMELEQNKAIVRGYLNEVLNEGNTAAFDRYFADDVVFNNSNDCTQLLARIQAIRSAFPDHHVSIEDQIAEGDKVVTRVTFRGTHQGEFSGIPSTGKPVKYSGIAIDRIANGKVVEMWHLANIPGLLQQIGS